MTFDAEGNMYAFVANGWVQRILLNGTGVNWAYVGGRPLAGEFDKEGNLYVCEAAKGLLMVEKGTKRVIIVAAQTVDNVPITYADDLGNIRQCYPL